jgi:hypothetical protein
MEGAAGKVEDGGSGEDGDGSGSHIVPPDRSAVLDEGAVSK